MVKGWLRRSTIFAVLTASCRGDDHGDHERDAASEFVNCVGETRADAYVPGLEKAGRLGGVRIRLVEMAPSPPVRGDNRWTVEVVDTAGKPLEGLTILVTPFMPDHQHGTPVRAQVTPAGSPGRYQLAPVNLFMPGLWEVTIQARDGADLRDQAVFSFCIPS